MTILLKRSVILHIPKTAGKYIEECLRLSNVEYRKVGLQPAIGSQCLFNRELSSHNIPHGLQEFEERKKRFMVIRHPLDWYKSYWAYRCQHSPKALGGEHHLYWRARKFGDLGGCIVDEKTHSDRFSAWIGNMANEFPDGAMGQFFFYYETLASDLCDINHLNEGLSKFLSENEKVSRLKKPKLKKNESSEEIKESAVYTPALAQSVQHIERRYMARHGYSLST